MSDTIDQLIQNGRALETPETEQEAIAYFKALAEKYPEHPRVIFEYAGAYDYAGYEAEAIPLYRKAQELGLSGDDLPRLYVQLGSSLRNVRQYDEAVALLTEGVTRYPEHTALKIFLSFALHSAEKHTDALSLMLNLLLTTITVDTLDHYERSIRYYVDELGR